MNTEKNADIEIPDMLTMMKIFSFAAKKSYQPIILFALLINELGLVGMVI